MRLARGQEKEFIMSAGVNKVMLLGNLTRDPELRYIPSGTAVASLGLAVNSRAGDREETLFVDVTVWGKSAEACNEHLAKGSQVHVDGRLRLESWEANDGQKRSRIKVVADRVVFLGGRRLERADTPVASPAAASTSDPAPATAPKARKARGKAAK